jgi:hypothetical protein
VTTLLFLGSLLKGGRRTGLWRDTGQGAEVIKASVQACLLHNASESSKPILVPKFIFIYYFFYLFFIKCDRIAKRLTIYFLALI